MPEPLPATNNRSGQRSPSEPWINHVNKVYPLEAEHIVRWFADRVQRPNEKVNHALILGGAPGIGKDTMLEPLKYAVGPRNLPRCHRNR